jgi:hypothetical protein
MLGLFSAVDVTATVRIPIREVNTRLSRANPLHLTGDSWQGLIGLSRYKTRSVRQSLAQEDALRNLRCLAR